MNIITNKQYLLYKGYKLKCCIGKSGLTNCKKEGDLATPKGLFKLGILYYRKDKIKLLKCKIKKRALKKIWDGVMTLKVKSITGKYTFHLNTKLKNFIEKIVFMIFLLI